MKNKTCTKDICLQAETTSGLNWSAAFHGKRLVYIILSRIGGRSNWVGLDVIAKQIADLILLRIPLFPRLLRSGFKKNSFECFRYNLHAMECAHWSRPFLGTRQTNAGSNPTPCFHFASTRSSVFLSWPADRGPYWRCVWRIGTQNSSKNSLRVTFG